MHITYKQPPLLSRFNSGRNTVRRHLACTRPPLGGRRGHRKHTRETLSPLEEVEPVCAPRVKLCLVDLQQVTNFKEMWGMWGVHAPAAALPVGLQGGERLHVNLLILYPCCRVNCVLLVEEAGSGAESFEK